MAWAPDYITAAAYKSWARIGDTVDDVEVALAITTASRAIDGTCHRQFGQLDEAATWYYTPIWDRHIGRWIITVDDITDITGLTVTVDDVATTDYVLEPRQAVAKGRAYTRLVLGADAAPTGDRDSAAVLDAFGWSTTPSAVQFTARLQTSRFLARRDSPFGIAGSPTDGSEMRLLARVDPDLAVGLASYIRGETP